MVNLAHRGRIMDPDLYLLLCRKLAVIHAVPGSEIPSDVALTDLGCVSLDLWNGLRDRVHVDLFQEFWAGIVRTVAPQ
jgi:hypothetical protein